VLALWAAAGLRVGAWSCRVGEVDFDFFFLVVLYMLSFGKKRKDRSGRTLGLVLT
jgi:hypothetical protein